MVVHTIITCTGKDLVKRAKIQTVNGAINEYEYKGWIELAGRGGREKMIAFCGLQK